MYLKGRLLKAAAICNYVCCALYFVLAASFFALSNNLYWMFLVFALLVLYDGFVIRSVADNMTSAVFGQKENTKLLVCWILSVVCPPSFVLCAIAYFRNKDDDSAKPARDKRSKRHETPANESAPVPATKKQKLTAFCKKPVFIVACASLAAVFLFGFFAMCFDTSGFSVKVTDFTLTREMTLAYNEGKINGKQYVIEAETDAYGNEHTGGGLLRQYVRSQDRYGRQPRARRIRASGLYPYQGYYGAVLYRAFPQGSGGVLLRPGRAGLNHG